MEKLNKLITILKNLILKKFTGEVKIHFGQGGICHVEKKENIELV